MAGLSSEPFVRLVFSHLRSDQLGREITSEKDARNGRLLF